MKTIEKESVIFYKQFFTRLNNHGNLPIQSLNSLTLPENTRRKLKRRWCRYLLKKNYTLSTPINKFPAFLTHNFQTFQFKGLP
jgi:hypothetical protein